MYAQYIQYDQRDMLFFFVLWDQQNF
jgi:hypothetical protein